MQLLHLFILLYLYSDQIFVRIFAGKLLAGGSGARAAATFSYSGWGALAGPMRVPAALPLAALLGVVQAAFEAHIACEVRKTGNV